MPSFGRIGKREGGEWGLGATEDRHVEQTDRNRRRSVEVLRCLAIRSRRSFGSWDHSAIDEISFPVKERREILREGGEEDDERNLHQNS